LSVFRYSVGFLTTVVIALLGANCSPHLGTNTCRDDGACLAGEYCKIESGEIGRCVAGQHDTAGDVDGDRVSDVPVDQEQEIDARGEVDSADSISDSQRDETDSADRVDVPVDQADSDEDGGSECLEENVYAYTLNVPLVERCGAGASSCIESTAELANCVHRPYSAHLIEVPLRNGIVDQSVSVYYTFDRVDESGAWLSEVNGQTASETDSDVGPHGLSQAAYDTDLHFTAGAAASGEDWSLAFWFKLDDWSAGSGNLFSTRQSAGDTDFLEISYQADGEDGNLSFHLAGPADARSLSRIALQAPPLAFSD